MDNKRSRKVSFKYLNGFMQREMNGKASDPFMCNVQRQVISKFEPCDRILLQVAPGLGAITTMDFDLNGALLVTGSHDGNISVFDMDEYHLLSVKIRNDVHFRGQQKLTPVGLKEITICIKGIDGSYAHAKGDSED